MVNAKKDVPKTQIVMEGLDVLETNACLRVSQIAIVNLIVIAILITDVVFQNVNLILAVKENTDVLMAIASSLVLHQLNVQIISNTATSKYHINLIFYCKIRCVPSIIIHTAACILLSVLIFNILTNKTFLLHVV